MGAILSTVYHYLFGLEAQVVMVGLDSAGKTTILNRLKLGKVVPTIPSIIFNVETFKFNGVSIRVRELGCYGKIRNKSLRLALLDEDGIIFVVDSKEMTRFDEAKNELMGFLEDDKLKGVPLLILANKHELQGAADSTVIAERFNLSQLTSERQWHVQECSTYNDDGLIDGFNWMADVIKARKLQKSIIHV